MDEEEDENVASESTGKLDSRHSPCINLFPAGPTQSPELALALAQVKRVKEKLADARIRGESDKKLKHDLGLQVHVVCCCFPLLSSSAAGAAVGAGAGAPGSSKRASG